MASVSEITSREQVIAEQIAVEQVATQEIKRFEIHQIIQHAGLMVSFIVLVITGLPIKFYDIGVSQWWVSVLGGVEATRTIHHVFAWAIVVVCFYHLIYIAYSTLILKKPFPVKMIPSLKDFTNIGHEIGYYVGLKKDKPRVDRFNWKEKFDYWAIFWGMPVMAGTGFILMYPVFVTKFLPGWMIPAALVAHTDEAMLALVWIFLVHIFFNHFPPGVFPLNTSIFTGKVSKERYSNEHALEFERLSGGNRDNQTSE